MSSFSRQSAHRLVSVQWVPLPERNKAEDLTPMHESGSNLSELQPPPPFHPPRQKPPIDYSRLPFDWVSEGSWGTVSTALPTRFRLMRAY